MMAGGTDDSWSETYCTVCWPMFILPKEIKRVSSEIYETADGMVYLNLSFFLFGIGITRRISFCKMFHSYYVYILKENKLISR